MQTAIDTPGREVTERALTWPDRARGAAVVDPETYGAAGELLLGIKALRKEVAETFDPHIQAAHRAHKALVAEKAKADGPLNEAEAIIKRALVAYDTEQERLRREEQRRREEEARRQAEAEALARAAALEAEAAAHGDLALKAEAEQMVEDAIIAPPPPVAPIQKATPKVAGISYREVWKFEIVDAAQLPRQFTKPDEQAIGAVVRGLKGNANIPGVRVYAVREIAAGGR